MADAYIPYAPLDAPKPVADDVWIVDGPEIRMDCLAGLSIPFPTRMTIVRLPDGALWLHSPVAFDEALARQIAALGRIAYLVAPNTLHYWYAPDWAARFPQAAFFHAPGLETAAKRRLPPGEKLGETPPPQWAAHIDQTCAEGGILNEVAFFHRASRTLVLTDLIENFEAARVRNPLMRAVTRFSGVADPDGKAPIDMQWSFFRHRAGLRRAVEKMIAWAPERVIIAHGRWYDRDGVAELRRAFRWVL